MTACIFNAGMQNLSSITVFQHVYIIYIYPRIHLYLASYYSAVVFAEHWYTLTATIAKCTSNRQLVSMFSLAWF